MATERLVICTIHNLVEHQIGFVLTETLFASHFSLLLLLIAGVLKAGREHFR